LKNIFRRIFPISLKLFRYPSSKLYHSCNLGTRFLLGGRLWHPRCQNCKILKKCEM
jgi:hypothetical protein